MDTLQGKQTLVLEDVYHSVWQNMYPGFCEDLLFLPKDVSFSLLAMLECSYLILFFNFSLSALILWFFLCPVLCSPFLSTSHSSFHLPHKKFSISRFRHIQDFYHGKSCCRIFFYFSTLIMSLFVVWCWGSSVSLWRAQVFICLWQKDI